MLWSVDIVSAQKNSYSSYDILYISQFIKLRTIHFSFTHILSGRYSQKKQLNLQLWNKGKAV